MAERAWSWRSTGTSEGGTSLLELVFLSALLVTLSGLAIPAMRAGLDEARTYAAARHLAGRLALARLEAVKHSANVAVRFVADGGTYRYASYLDGNGNGVRADDIGRGVDRALNPPERLGDLFAGVQFEILDGVSAIEGGGTLGSQADPVRLGRAGMLSFSPTGSATSGTLYLRGRCTCQYAVRVLGVTGRTRVLEFRPGTRQWVAR